MSTKFQAKLLWKNQNKVCLLDKPVTLVGSGAMCDLIIPKLSPMSFKIIRKANDVQFMNIGKDHILVNDRKVDLKPLTHRDRIHFAGIELEFSSSDEKTPLHFNSNPSNLKVHEIMEEMTSLLGSVLDEDNEENTLTKLIASVCLLMKADHGVLAAHHQDKEIKYCYPDDNIAVSGSAVNKALKEKKAVLWSLSDQEVMDMSKSIADYKLTSILVAPFTISNQFNGYLYVQRQAKEDMFITEDQKFFDHLCQQARIIFKSNLEKKELIQRIEDLKDIKSNHGLIYSCDVMDKVVSLALKAAPMPVPVLILGETGTGKEVMARFIHLHSHLHEKKFLAVNCGAIPSNLIESELFGHMKGSFTGAHQDKKGIFEDCEGGTLFLDEIGELPMEMQVKLLRVIQEKKVTPIGSTREIKVNFRLISATHVNLTEAIHEHMFREDLFFRLNVMTLKLPPLRERGADTIILGESILKRFVREYSISQKLKFSKSAEKALLSHRWPGNIRELENKIQKAIIQTESENLSPEDLGLGANEVIGKKTLKEAREDAELRVVDSALSEAKGNLTLAASILGIDRKVLRELMERLDISKESYKETKKAK